MRAAGATRRRELSGWGAFVAAVFALRLAGMGTPPAEVSAAFVDGRGSPTGPEAAAVASAFGRLVADLDVAPFAAATSRCLEAGAACAADDVLDADTTRVRLATLAAELLAAGDPTDPAYLGPPDEVTTRRVRAIRAAATAEAEALRTFLSSGCAGSVDGVAVALPSADCVRAVADVRRTMAVFAGAIDQWRIGAP